MPHSGPEAEINRKKDFVSRTLDSFSSFLTTALFSEKYAKAKGLLQTIDPRFKIVTIFLMVVLTSLLHRLEILLGLYLFTLLLAYLSNVGIGFFVKRVWLFIPIFSGIIVIPALFNQITPGEPLLTFIQPGGYLGPWELSTGLSITVNGASSAVLFVMRVATSVSLVVLLTLTTKWSDILCALQVLRIPQAFVMTLGMAHRYIYLLLKLAEDMHLVRKSRTIRSQSLRENQNWVGTRMAQLLRRSFKTSEEVHLAMLARGFDGKARGLSMFRAERPDYVWLAFSILLGVMIICLM